MRVGRKRKTPVPITLARIGAAGGLPGGHAEPPRAIAGERYYIKEPKNDPKKRSQN